MQISGVTDSLIGTGLVFITLLIPLSGRFTLNIKLFPNTHGVIPYEVCIVIFINLATSYVYIRVCAMVWEDQSIFASKIYALKYLLPLRVLQLVKGTVWFRKFIALWQVKVMH